MKSNHMSGFDVFATVLVILGAINLGLFGIFGYHFIDSILGGQTVLIRIVYALIGLAGVWLICVMCKCRKSCPGGESHHHGG